MRILVGHATGSCSDGCLGIHNCTEMEFEARFEGERHSEVLVRAHTRKEAVVGLIEYLGTLSMLDKPASAALAKAVGDYTTTDFTRFDPKLKPILAEHGVTIE